MKTRTFDTARWFGGINTSGVYHLLPFMSVIVNHYSDKAVRDIGLHFGFWTTHIWVGLNVRAFA